MGFMAAEGAKERTRGKKAVSPVYLIADSRERNVHPFLDAEFQEYAYLVKQVTTGDYLICRAPPRGGAQRGPEAGPAVLAAIERKTLEDFAASFKDGRHENVKKLRALREQTGCQLYYFVEGPAFPSPSRRFSRIPYANILAAITKLMMRDGIFVVQTENESHTAKRLADFVRAFDAEQPYVAPCPSVGSGAMQTKGPAGCAAEDEGEVAAMAESAATGAATCAAEREGAAESGADWSCELTVPDVLTARVEQTDDEAAVAVWARLRGVSVVLGKILTREFSVAELAAQAVPPERLRALKTATGRAINKDAQASLASVRGGSAEHAAKLLSGLRNVTPAVAKIVLAGAGGLRRLCESHPAFVAGIELPQKGRTVKLGKARAERIWRILHYKEGSASFALPRGRSFAPGLPPGPAPLPALPARQATEAQPRDSPLGFASPLLGGAAEGPEPAEPLPALADDDLASMLEAAGWA